MVRHLAYNVQQAYTCDAAKQITRARTRYLLVIFVHSNNSAAGGFTIPAIEKNNVDLRMAYLHASFYCALSYIVEVQYKQRILIHILMRKSLSISPKLCTTQSQYANDF